MNQQLVIGIDLGTTQSCTAFFHDGQVEIIPNDQGNLTTPSCVVFVGENCLLGENAKDLEVISPQNTIFDMHHIIGRQLEDSPVQFGINHCPFDRNDQPRANVQLNRYVKTYSAEEISIILLTKLKESAEAYLGTTVKDAVITVPACFNDFQKRAIRDAGIVAGLNVLRIINKPTAVALAFSIKENISIDQNIMVFYLGGGTFDVSILKLLDRFNFEVKSTASDMHLGGQDFDNRMVDYFAGEILRKHGKYLKESPKSVRRLKRACEEAKRSLSTNMETSIMIDSLFQKIDFSSKITRARFEDLCIDLFRTTIKLVERAIHDAGMTKDDIDQLILAGGSTRIPKIRKLLEECMQGVKINCDIYPEVTAAKGAAFKAAIVNGQFEEPFGRIVLTDTIPASLGIETEGHRMTKFIHNNTRFPVRVSKEFITFSDNQRSAVIRVFQGEEELTKDNNFLGQFELILPPATKIKTHIAVTFELNVNGILTVEAVNQDTGLSRRVIF